LYQSSSVLRAFGRLVIPPCFVQREDDVDERDERRRLGQGALLALEEPQLVLQLRVEEHVIDARRLRQGGEIDLAER
jgi:hypothetical protein